MFLLLSKKAEKEMGCDIGAVEQVSFIQPAIDEALVVFFAAGGVREA